MIFGICPYVAEHISKMIDQIYSQPLDFQNIYDDDEPVSNESKELLSAMLRTKTGKRADWPEQFSFNFNYVNKLGDIFNKPSPALRRFRHTNFPKYIEYQTENSQTVRLVNEIQNICKDSQYTLKFIKNLEEQKIRSHRLKIMFLTDIAHKTTKSNFLV